MKHFVQQTFLLKFVIGVHLYWPHSAVYSCADVSLRNLILLHLFLFTILAVASAVLCFIIIIINIILKNSPFSFPERQIPLKKKKKKLLK